MKGTYFDPVFKYGGKFGIVDSLTSRVRIVAGFLEPMVSDEMIGGVRGKTGPEHRGKYRLLLPAGEDFNKGADKLILCGDEEYELVCAHDIFFDGKVTHRECIVKKKGGWS